jgi:hypothetical protein
MSPLEPKHGGGQMSEVKDILADMAGIGADGHPTAQPAEAKPPLKPLNVWRPSQFLAWVEPPGMHLLLPKYVTKGQLATLIGQGGLGKTRLAIWLAVCQILGKPWCGIDTGGEPQKWLVLGSENSISRFKDDLEKIFGTLPQSEMEKVDANLGLQAVEDFEDADLNLGETATRERVKLTIEQWTPGGIILDPLGDFAPGDIAKPGDMREAVRLLLSIVRAAAPKAAILLLHHARVGRSNILQSVGYDAANFGLGGKALFASARCVMNLAPGSEEDDTRLLLHCAKANNCPRFRTTGLIFNPNTFAYGLDPNFDLESWQASVAGKVKSGGSGCTVADVVEAVRDGYNSTKALLDHLTEVYQATKRSIERLISNAVKCQGLKKFTRGKYILGAKSEKILNPEGYK